MPPSGQPARHPTLTQSFSHRASLPNTHPLAAYLLNLITIKQSNLCVSADVSSSAVLLQLAEDVGDSICMLKTHADIVDDWSERTVQRLKEISRQKGFLLFEDRKFGDIGNTVQKQYTSGHHRIATWAAIVNAHIFPGPSIITALQEAAAATLTSLNQSVSTEISAGTPRSSSDGDYSHSDADADDEGRAGKYSSTGRKRSIVTATTISQYTERTVQQTPLIIPRSVPNDYYDDDDDDSENGGARGKQHRRQQDAAAVSLDEPPVARGLLLLAEMSSEGNLLTGDYTRRCVETARQHRDFVLGFIAQRSMNSESGDNFICFTPGVSLPPSSSTTTDTDDDEEEDDDDNTDDEEEEDDDAAGDGVRSRAKSSRGDGLGQRYNTPRKVVLKEGCDVVIVGRGILKARDRKKEAERYRREAWRAYVERIKGR